MPNRYIREAAIESEGVNSLSWIGEVFFRRLLNRVDDFGRFTANHSLLRARIFPLQLDKVRDSEIPRLLAECEKAGLLFVYTANSKAYLIVNRWEKGRAKTSAYPEPPPDVCERMETHVYGCKHVFADVPDSDSDTDSDSDSDTDKAPPGVLNCDVFRRSWAEYVAYRVESRFKPLKARSVEKTWNEMAAWGLDAAVASVEATIKNGWQGLFAPKANFSGKRAPATTVSEFAGKF